MEFPYIASRITTKPIYDPDHPIDPNPPTFWNRLRCRLHGHFDHFDYFDNTRNEIHLICVRCSRVLVRGWPKASVGLDDQVNQY